MKRTIDLVVVFASMLVLGLVHNAHAGEGNTCTNATLKGPYGLIASGTVFTQGLNAQVSVLTFDGERNVSIIGTNVSEQRGVEHITAETPGAVGTYTVNPNCTGSYALGVRTFDFVIVDGGKEILQIATLDPPRSVVTGVLKKQFPQQN